MIVILKEMMSFDNIWIYFMMMEHWEQTPQRNILSYYAVCLLAFKDTLVLCQIRNHSGWCNVLMHWGRLLAWVNMLLNKRRSRQSKTGLYLVHKENYVLFLDSSSSCQIQYLG